MTIKGEELRLIVSMADAGCTNKQIAAATGKKAEAIRQWLVKYRLNQSLPPKVIVDKTITSGRTSLEIKRLISDNPKLTIRDIERKLKDAAGPYKRTPSKSTIGRFLIKNNLVMIKLLKKPLVSIRNIGRRLEFAQKWLEDPDELIYNTIWSDETTVRKMPQGKDILYRVHSSVQKDSLPRNRQIQQGGFSVMFWGCFSSMGLGPLVALEGNQNQHTYVETLREYLLPELAAAKAEFDMDMIFMQDNAPCHKTHKVMDFLADNQVRTLEWPAQSPDLNPIENLWAIIKHRRQKKFGFPTTKIELVDQIFEIWNEVDEELCETLAESIENRLKEVIRLGGQPTKY